MAEEEKLKLGKGTAFVKGRLKRLPRGDETWEADFRALPRPIEQTQTHYLGMVVTGEDGSLLAVCSYAVTRVYRRDGPGEAMPWKLLAEARYPPQPIEGVTWDGRDLILVAEEARGLYRLREAAWRAVASREGGSRAQKAE